MENNKEFQKDISNSKSRIYGVVAFCLVVLFVAFATFNIYYKYYHKPSPPKPPDLSRCTRLEVIFPRPLVEFLGSEKELGPDFLSASELDYCKSLDRVVIDDRENIEKIANALSFGRYMKGVEISPMVYRYYINPPSKLSVIGYRNIKRVVFITNYGLDYIRTENGEIFVYDIDLPNLYPFLKKLSQPFSLRFECVHNLWILSADVNASMDHTNWCDIILQRKMGDNEKNKEVLKCPGASEGECNYAINPNCVSDSPGDMVFIFEAKAGWNQHGGPELFTFDNHDPKRPAPDVLPSLQRSSGGGCVLLNDGTVKFIRTEEELNTLRWK